MQGPVSTAALAALARKKEIHSATMVWSRGCAPPPPSRAIARNSAPMHVNSIMRVSVPARLRVPQWCNAGVFIAVRCFKEFAWEEATRRVLVSQSIVVTMRSCGVTSVAALAYGDACLCFRVGSWVACPPGWLWRSSAAR